MTNAMQARYGILQSCIAELQKRGILATDDVALPCFQDLRPPILSDISKAQVKIQS